MLIPDPHQEDSIASVWESQPTLFLLGESYSPPAQDVWIAVPMHEIPRSITALPDIVAAWQSYEYSVGVGAGRVAIARRDGTDVFRPIDARAIATKFLGAEFNVALVMPGVGFNFEGYWILEVVPELNNLNDLFLC